MTLAVFAAACLVLWLVSAFVATPYVVSGSSASKTLLNGDRVLVVKTAYGPRLPVERLFHCRRILKSTPSAGDWMAFNMPDDTLHSVTHRKVCIGQCIGTPGSAVNLTRQGFIAKPGDKGTFRFDVPAKGQIVNVTPWNARIICNAVNLHEPCHFAELKGDTLMLDGHSASEVMFTQDYFWIYSGSQNDMHDTRSFGLLPESHIIGKVELVIFSADPAKPWLQNFRSGRFFMPVSNK